MESLFRIRTTNWDRYLVCVARDTCFHCGRRSSPFCDGCMVAICAGCDDTPRRQRLLRDHPPEAHRSATRRHVVKPYGAGRVS